MQKMLMKLASKADFVYFSYWDVSLNGYNYSYVREATDVHKYATFFYDRLGAGLSSHPDPIEDTQVWLQVESLAALTNMARRGQLPGTNGIQFEKIIQVGHSFGSVQINTLTTLYPNISDAIVLTGFSLNDTWQPEVIFGGNLLQANNISRFAENFSQDGYVAVGDVSAVELLFFGPGDFAQLVLEGAFETANPIAIGELLMSTGTSGVKNDFSGPVLIVTGGKSLLRLLLACLLMSSCRARHSFLRWQLLGYWQSFSALDSSRRREIISKRSRFQRYDYSERWTRT